MIAARTLATLSLVLSLASCSEGSDTADASAAPLAATFENVQAGLRTDYHPHYYGAFIIDPEGNNIEAVCHRPE